MKKTAIILCLLAFALSACKPDPEPEPEPAPNNGGQNNDTTETVVKKYLVKEYYADFPDEPLKVIEWNDDFTRITHITTYKNNPYQLDFSFEYYGDDSLRVVLSKPADSWAIALFSDYMCHFDGLGRIKSVDYYRNSEYQCSDIYNYDLSGKLVSIVDTEHNGGTQFVWDYDNVCEISTTSGELLYSFGGFTNHYHPYSTLPYLLKSGDGYHSMMLTKPLWKNWYTNNSQGGCYEFDEDGYVDYAYFITIDGDTNSRICYDYLK